MDVSGWRTSLVVHAVDPRTGSRVSLAVGLVDTVAGGVQIAMRVGVDGKPLILSLQEAAQLELHVKGTLAERYRLALERLGGEGS